MQTLPHLHFRGNCREAFEFYAANLGGRIAFAMTYAEAPGTAETPAAMRNQIIHARLEFGGAAIAGCDVPPERYQKAQGFNVIAVVPQLSEAARIFGALAAGGATLMPFGPTFWAQGFGMCTDRFGTPWMVNCEKPA
jgi:PhnB protein